MQKPAPGAELVHNESGDNKLNHWTIELAFDAQDKINKRSEKKIRIPKMQKKD